MAEVNADLDLSTSFTTRLYVASTKAYKGEINTFIPFDTDSHVAALSSAFESIALRRAVIQLRGPCLDSGYLRASLIPRDVVDAASMDTAVVADMAFFSPQAPLSFDLVLPAGHSFGVELKGATLGNQVPKVYITSSGLPTSVKEVRTLFVRYVLELECSGRSPTRSLLR